MIATDVQTVERREPVLPGSRRGVPLCAFALLGLGGLLRARRNRRRIGRVGLWIVLLATAGLGISGCGGKGSGAGTGALTPKGTGNLTVTATGTGATQMLTISVTID